MTERVFVQKQEFLCSEGYMCKAEGGAAVFPNQNRSANPKRVAAKVLLREYLQSKSRGAEARFLARVLRGAEAPLFHGFGVADGHLVVL